MRPLGILTAIFVCLFSSVSLHAKVPNLFNYQGRLTGVPVPDGKYTFTLANENGGSTPVDMRVLERQTKQARIEAQEAYIKQLEAEQALEDAKRQQ